MQVTRTRPRSTAGGLDPLLGEDWRLLPARPHARRGVTAAVEPVLKERAVPDRQDSRDRLVRAGGRSGLGACFFLCVLAPSRAVFCLTGSFEGLRVVRSASPFRRAGDAPLLRRVPVCRSQRVGTICCSAHRDAGTDGRAPDVVPRTVLDRGAGPA
jgi:hypothetical protein